MARRRTPIAMRRDMQRRRDAWAAAAEFGHGFSRAACLRIVAELDREIAKYDVKHDRDGLWALFMD